MILMGIFLFVVIGTSRKLTLNSYSFNANGRNELTEIKNKKRRHRHHRVTFYSCE